MPMAKPSALDVARAWLARGAQPIPIPYGQKGPTLPEWQKLHLTADTLPDYFNGARQNAGVLLGEPSGGLVCVDLDVREAVQLAPACLPPTGLQHGRASRPRSHWFYRVVGPIPASKRYDDPTRPDGDKV